MLRTKKMFAIPILLFSFLVASSFADNQGCCGRMMGGKGDGAPMGMMKGGPMAMMKGGPGWWSKSNHSMECPWWNPGEQEIANLTKEKAKKSVEDYLFHYGNPNLKVGKVKEKDDYFEVEIVTKDNSLVEKLKVDRKTGWMETIR